MRAILYVNQNQANFAAMRFADPAHVFICHGESDKDYMSSNQLKAYDRVFIAGTAARERIMRKLIGFDESSLVEVGRPQVDVDFPGPSLPHDGRTVVLFAPTWEGDRASMRYSSVISHGPAMVRALVATGRHRVIYRPHPRTGISLREAAAAHADVIRVLRDANSADPTAGHVVDVEGGFGWQLAASDVAVMDISAVAYDWLATGKPLLVTRPAEPRAAAARVGPGARADPVRRRGCRARARDRRCGGRPTPTPRTRPWWPATSATPPPARAWSASWRPARGSSRNARPRCSPAARWRATPSRRPVESREHAASGRPRRGVFSTLDRSRGGQLVAAALVGRVTPHLAAAALRSARTCWRCSLVSGPHGRLTAASCRQLRCWSVSPSQKARAFAKGSVTSHFWAAASTLPRRAARSASSSGPTGRVIAASFRQVRCVVGELVPPAASRGAGGGDVGGGVADRVGHGADACAHRVGAELGHGGDGGRGRQGVRRDDRTGGDQGGADAEGDEGGAQAGHGGLLRSGHRPAGAGAVVT